MSPLLKTTALLVLSVVALTYGAEPELDKLGDDEKLEHVILPDTGKGFERPQSNTDDGPADMAAPSPRAQQQAQFQQFQPQMINPQMPQFGQQGQMSPQMQFAMMQQQQQLGGQFRPSIVQGTRMNPSPPEFFPPRPPLGYENILPPDTFKRLVAVHQNLTLSIPERKKQIDAIMAEVPQETLEMLPLPPALYKLPATELNAVKKIFANKNLGFDQKNEEVRKFIRNLPTPLKRLVRPPLPRGFENLPEVTKDKIDELYEMDGLSEDARYNKILKVVNMLPPELRAKLPPPPPRQWPNN